MKEKNFDTTLTFIFSGLAFFLVLLLFFVYVNSRADMFYSKLDFITEPSIEAAKLDYYRTVIMLTSQALQYNGSNASYWEKKADYLVAALDAGLKEPLAINSIDVENLYKKAISLNPINYECHLKLGLFLANKGNKKLAEEEFLKAVELHPTNFMTYLYLAKYYIRNQDEKEALGNLLLALCYSPKFNWYTFNNIMKDDIVNLKAISLNEREQELKYVIFPAAEIFDFKSQKFPHRQIPIKIRVYAKRPVSAISLNYNGLLFRHLHWKEAVPELDVYELDLDAYPPHIYLDDLLIVTNPSAVIEKIEFIFKI